MLGASHGYGQVLDKGVEFIGVGSPVAVDVVQDLIKEEQYRSTCSLHQLLNRGCAWRNILRGGPEYRHTFIASQLTGDINPRCFAPFTWVPGIANEHRHFGARDLAKSNRGE